MLEHTRKAVLRPQLSPAVAERVDEEELDLVADSRLQPSCSRGGTRCGPTWERRIRRPGYPSWSKEAGAQDSPSSIWRMREIDPAAN